MKNKSVVLIQTLLFGSYSVFFYFLLYHFNDLILDASKQGGWYFIVPIMIAFSFSVVHGAFTGYFWELLGVKAKAVKGK
ncbi:MAG: hypothetical protein KAH84_00740 [Thiomargarita sp.]|nr:hypothetical protein [Thiomargarita sp.]